MKFLIDLDGKKAAESQIVVLTAFQKKDGEKTSLVKAGWDKNTSEYFDQITTADSFKASSGENFTFNHVDGQTYLVLGLGEKTKVKSESYRKAIAKTFKTIHSLKAKSVFFDLDQLNCLRSLEKTAHITAEAIGLTSYTFDKYLSKKKEKYLETVILHTKIKKDKLKIEKEIEVANTNVAAINFARDLVNEAPNVQNSEYYAKQIEDDVKTSLKGTGVKVKILNKAQIQKENMNLFLSVNNGSGYEPRLVHLTYTPKKKVKTSKHIAVVGKGLVFDTGGYSLKPAANMMNMKFDMAGSASVYAAFRTAVLQNCPHQLTCILGITDNAVNSFATKPDSIVTARNGKTVEILNTDAEGRLVLADALDYTCDLKPDYIIDAATLTGAVLTALGQEIAGLMTNDEKFADLIKKSAANVDEYVWQLPIIEEFRNDMKSPVADLQNIGASRLAGTATAAAFLEEFIKNDVKWAHLDIAGMGDSQKHLPYCPPKGASGMIIRTIADFMMNAKL